MAAGSQHGDSGAMRPPAPPKSTAPDAGRRRLVGGLGASALLMSLPGCGGGPAPGWSPPLAVASASGQASGLRVVWGGGGSALAVWETETAGVRRVMAAWLDSTASTLGFVSTALDTPDSGAPRLPDAAMDASDRAWVVWRQAQPAGGDWVLARRFEPGVGWLAVEVLGPAAIGADRPPCVAMDAIGRTTATWLRDSPSARPVVARTWSPGGAWTAERRLDTLDTPTRPPVVTIDGRGHGIVAWPQRLTPFSGPLPPWGSDVDPGAAGSITVQVETLGVEAELLRVITLSGGQVLLAWRANPLPAFALVATSLYTPGAGWSVPLQPSGTVTSIPALALAAGPANASAVWWVEGDGTRERLLFQRLAGAAVPFNPPWSLADAAAGTRLWPHGVMTRAGEVVSLWESGPSGTAALWTQTQTANAAFGPTQRLDEGSTAGVLASGIARGPGDLVVAAWLQPTAGGHRLWLRWLVP